MHYQIAIEFTYKSINYEYFFMLHSREKKREIEKGERERGREACTYI